MSNAEGQHFITFFVAIYDQNKGRFKYVNSGHNPPILIHEGKTKYLQEGSTVLGAFNELPFLNVGIIEDLDEFLFCAFTDGLTEITNNSGEEFGEQRISEVMEEHINDEPLEINDAIINRLNDFKEGNFYKDDITLMTCRILK
jgi:sigma-B regulation protein RsbU (phosphoserine phosphatase)